MQTIFGSLGGIKEWLEKEQSGDDEWLEYVAKNVADTEQIF